MHEIRDDDGSQVRFALGVKTDPILYRYSYAWLFRLMEQEGVQHAQLGTFFEIYSLPDDWFRDLRRCAADCGVTISSVFTAHRELGGFFRDDGQGWSEVARRNFQRLVEVAELVGAQSVGSNPGAVLRDRMGTKRAGLACYMGHFKELMRFAGERGVKWLTIEPMSCLAEPPTLPGEMAEMGRELGAYYEGHRGAPGTPGSAGSPGTSGSATTAEEKNRGSRISDFGSEDSRSHPATGTPGSPPSASSKSQIRDPKSEIPIARPGYCVDVAHGYANASKQVVHDHFELMRAAVGMTSEVHLKNTDAYYNSTFGFGVADRERGIIDMPAVRGFYEKHAAELPVKTLVGYLEVGGPKLGRDYSDGQLEGVLRESLQYLKQTWESKGASAAKASPAFPGNAAQAAKAPREAIQVVSSGVGAGGIDPPKAQAVKISPSLMCADLLNLEQHIGRLRAAGMADMLHLDLMDGQFAPNMALGLTLIEQLRPRTDLPLDVHLMVHEPAVFVNELIRMKAERVAVHVEAVKHLDRMLNQLRDGGVQVGVALNPATPLHALEYVLDTIDFVLLMTVNPGFAGQKLCKGSMRKIADCRRLLEGRAISIEVDGNVSFANIPGMVGAGASELVCGSSSVFSTAGSLEENARKVREAIREGLAGRAPGAASGGSGIPAASPADDREGAARAKEKSDRDGASTTDTPGMAGARDSSSLALPANKRAAMGKAGT